MRGEASGGIILGRASITLPPSAARLASPLGTPPVPMDVLMDSRPSCRSDGSTFVPPSQCAFDLSMYLISLRFT